MNKKTRSMLQAIGNAKYFAVFYAFKSMMDMQKHRPSFTCIPHFSYT